MNAVTILPMQANQGNPFQQADLFRSDGLDVAVALYYHVESPQSVVQGCSAQGSAVGSGEKES